MYGEQNPTSLNIDYNFELLWDSCDFISFYRLVSVGYSALNACLHFYKITETYFLKFDESEFHLPCYFAYYYISYGTSEFQFKLGLRAT